MTLTLEQARQIFDLLIKENSVPPRYGPNFVSALTENDKPHFEYRIWGRLGAGGRIHCEHNSIWVVCDDDDRTPKRQKVLDTLNTRLRDLMKSWGLLYFCPSRLVGECLYSRAMDQVYPRRCINCGIPEPPRSTQ